MKYYVKIKFFVSLKLDLIGGLHLNLLLIYFSNILYVNMCTKLIIVWIPR